ncbi:MAG TPA: hypothetical protein VF316_15465, partial [Polyangiaceae bacterium]
KAMQAAVREALTAVKAKEEAATIVGEPSPFAGARKETTGAAEAAKAANPEAATPPPPSKANLWAHREASPPVQAKPPRQKRPVGAILFVVLLLAGLVGGGFAWRVQTSKGIATATDAGAAPDAESLLASGLDEDAAADEGDDVDLDDADADVLDAAIDAPAEAARPAFVPPKKKPPTKKPPRKRRW